MASALLANNHSERNWSQHRGGGAEFMGKVPFSNSNPNPKFSNKRTQSPSDDASSINRRSNDIVSYPQHVTFNISSYTKKEIVELKNRFTLELEQIRQLNSRIENGEFQIRPTPCYNGSSGKKSAISKKVSGNKRPLPMNSAKELKRSHSEIANLMKNCSQVLQKLMRHKFGWIFNVPVDVVGLGLHDYYDIIKKPMDLGTVKLNLAKNVYSSPSEFAADVRLTFNNALKYNPKGHDVYALAEQFLARFEELYGPLNEKLEREDQVFEEELQGSSWNNHVEPERVERVERVKKKENERENLGPPPKLQEPVSAPASSSNPPPLLQSPVRTPSPMHASLVKPLKQPKPKARDLNKRDMTLEEKHRLGMGLQSLPSEKMEQVVQIIRKRNGDLEQDGDEIELDIEAVDTETLWELDRLVTNYKKMVSKIKRQALMGNYNNVASNKSNGELSSLEKIDTAMPIEAKKPKKMEAAVDEDVDIGDDIPMSNFPPVEIEKDKDVVGGHASSSSSSSGSSSTDSSSSGSDSGSSSGSDSEAENGH
ncbi:PREDICTED: transcription factor GTE7-like isoform X1 [Lupinus angustifolius]|uniref:transcription factor GTE7-like isoform X1 n=1 Tax=Lupinus angustifolius TaxID=3871 RepID=UPI00092E8D0F|nr:PREDICTED: transcription factor GTE7-like isoform X1 [Lupinus angustifolius]